MTSKPFFSVIIPTYNRAAFIKQSVLSVLTQNYEQYEVIVVDDGSQDNTKEIVSRINSKKVRYIYQNNNERAVARNRGVQESTGDYITFLDSDDILYSDYFKKASALIIRNNNPPFAHLGYEIINSSGCVLSRINSRKGSLNNLLIEGNSLSCIGICIRKDIATLHPFKEDRRIIGSEDYELWMRLASRYPMIYSNEVTAALIQHESRSVLGFESRQLIERVELTVKYILEDEMFNRVFYSSRNRLVAHRYLYLSLHLVMSNRQKLGLWYWRKAVVTYPKVLFHRKTFGILSNIIFHK